MQLSLFGFLHSGFKTWVGGKQYVVTKLGQGRYRLEDAIANKSWEVETPKAVTEHINQDMMGIARH